MRKTFAEIRLRSRLPQVIGLCADNASGIAAWVNEAQDRLIRAGGETGWWGGWEKVVFSVDRTDPYITLPRQYARAINMAACRHPFQINNQFYSVLPGGPGLPADPSTVVDWSGDIQGYDEGTTPTLVDLPATSTLRLYATDPADIQANRRILITCLDANGVQVYSQDGYNQVNGFYLNCGTPFTDSTFTVSKIQAITKDETVGRMILKAVDPLTGVETTLADYGPGETSPAYRRYRITALPPNCCPTTGGITVQVTALCKLEFIPVAVDTDYLIIGNIPALILECQAIRFEEMDDPQADAKAQRKHADAIMQLKSEMRHYLGEQVPAIAIDRWQGENLTDQSIGSMQ